MTDLPDFPPRDASGHKGTFGTVCVIGGQAMPPRVMIGSPALSATAALRSGAGLAVLAVPRPLMAAALVLAPSATGLALPVDRERTLRASDVAALLDEHRGEFDCIAVGPGWGRGEPQQQILVRLLAQGDVPVVIDADGVNALSEIRDVQSDIRVPMVLTPHPGEYRRLAASLGLALDPVDPDARIVAARDLAARLGCVVVLKGPGTVISDGHRVAVNASGNSALATAGTGDVLTGIIAGIIAQFHASGVLDLFGCARLAVHVHGRAADRWAERHGESGLLAAELHSEIPEVIAKLRGA